MSLSRLTELWAWAKEIALPATKKTKAKRTLMIDFRMNTFLCITCAISIAN
jgi:hypothetical protein